MPGIFEVSNIPSWMNPTRAILEEDSSQIGAQFGASFRQSQAMAEKKTLLKQQLTKSQDVVRNLAGADTPEKAWDIVSKNPQWLADPQTAPAVQNYLKAQTEVARAEVNSIQGKTKIADITNFTKRISALPDPADRASIQGMNANQDGSISAMQWQALSLAEERSKIHAENVKKQAEIEALQRGDVVSTTVSDRGVSKTFKPPAPSASTKAFTPEAPLEFKDGSKLIHTSPQRWQYVAAGGLQKDLSAEQLRGIAKDLQERNPDDPVASQILDALASAAKKQVSPTSTTKATPNRVLKFNPATGKIE